MKNGMTIGVYIVAFIFVAMGGIYLLGRFRISEGFCNKSEVEIFDLLSLSYKCIPSKNILSLPTCRPSQILMMANPSDQIHCGTIKGDPRYSKDCVTNTQYELDYTLTCPDAPKKIPVAPVDTTSSSPKISQFNITDTTSCPPIPLPSVPETPKLDKSELGSTITEKTTFGLGIPPRPTFGPRYQTIVSNLIIQSKPTPYDSSSLQNTKKTPSNIKYDEATSSGSGSNKKTKPSGKDEYKSTDISSGPSEYTSSAESTMTPTVYKFSAPVSDYEKEKNGSTWGRLINAVFGKESGSSGNTKSSNTKGTLENNIVNSSSNISSSSSSKSNVYNNIPFPYMPKFKI